MRSLRPVLAAVLAVTSLAVVPARATTPALFKVGFSTVIIDPTRPQYLGGFGYGDPVQNLASPDDHMEVRAIAIADPAGANLVELAIVDTQGYFAGNQEGPWGNRDARLDAAAQLKASFPNVTDSNIIVSSTHSHAAPTIMGIWGTTDPDYLKQVHDGTVAALVQAASDLHDANLYAATADISPTIIAALTQTDGYQGWPVDGRTPVLWAREPGTGATLGLYTNVPVHADIVNGVGHHIISADHVGVERRALDADLGGDSVVAMGTLGRQESIIQVGGLAHATALGTYATNQIERALATARPLTDGTVAAAQQYVLIPATNPALAGLNIGNRVADAATQAGVTDSITAHCSTGDLACTIDRETLPPYAAGDAFGTWFTALRIGDLMYASEPGEAFTEVSDAIRQSIPGVDVRVIGMAQDQLGYYFPPETIPWTAFNNSDHHIYNSSLALGEINVQSQSLNAQALGFATQVVHVTSEFTDTVQAQHAGVQFFPVKGESVDHTVTFDAKRSGSAFGSATSGGYWTDGFSGKITWEFGDGTGALTDPGMISHTYADAGHYTVRASVTDPRDDHVSTFEVPIVIDPLLSASVSTSGTTLTARASGGQGSVIAAHWTFDDASTADGLKLQRPLGTTGSVTIIDGAGNQATTSF